MNGNLGRDKVWNQQTWNVIDDAVRVEVGRTRVAQKVFPSTLLTSGQQVPKDELSAKVTDILQIEEGQTKPFVEIWVEFSLTQSQVDSEESLHMGCTLARIAANRIAAKEDTLLFQGSAPSAGAAIRQAINTGKPSPPQLVKDVNDQSLGHGLLGPNPGTQNAHQHCIVQYSKVPNKGPTNLVDEVFNGIAKLNNGAHFGPYALFLPPKMFADASSTTLPNNTVTAADRITTLVTGGFLPTGSLPPSAGLLVSLGGDPAIIYLGIDATTAFTQIQANGIYLFRVFERIQFVIRDQTAFVRLQFT